MSMPTEQTYSPVATCGKRRERQKMPVRSAVNATVIKLTTNLISASTVQALSEALRINQELANVEAQIEQVMANCSAMLTAAGAGFERVVKTTIFLVDMADFAVVNAVYGRHFATNPPARSTVQVAALPRGVAVEVEMVVYCGS